MSLRDTKVRRSIVRELARRQGEGCAYCRSPLTPPPAGGSVKGRPDPPTTRTIDHLIPRARGGSSHVNNLALACFQCNVAKGSRLPLEFIASRARPIGAA